MLIGAEVALLVLGLYALFTGKLLLRSKPPVTGWRARIIGIIYLLPIPLAFIAGILITIVWVFSRHDQKDRALFWYVTGTEAGILVVCVVIASLLQRIFQKQVRAELADEELNAPPVDE